MGRDGARASRNEGADARSGRARRSRTDFHHTFLYQMDYRGQGKPGLLRRYAGSERNYRIMLDNEENPYTTVAGYRLSLGTLALPGRTHPALGARHRPHGRLRVQGGLARRLRHGLGRHLRRHEAVLRSRRELHRRERRDGGLPQFPDGPFLPPMPLNCAETIFTAACKSLGWPSTHRRLAQLTRMHNNRPPCHYCGNCVNGCDVGAMFNTIAVTLPPALKTGNLEVRTDSVVARVRMNSENRAQGVTYIERLHDEVGRRRCEVRHPGRLDAREHAAAAAFGEGRTGELERHARPVHDGPGRRRRRERIPAQAQGRPEPSRRRQSRRASRSRTSRTSTAKTRARTSSAAT